MIGRPKTPMYQDAPTLCGNLCISEGTLDNWVRKGILPAPKLVGGKRLWKWSEVERKIESPTEQSDAEKIRDATKAAAHG